MWVRRCLICPAANLAYAQQLATAAVGPSASGMWPSALSPTGLVPATHFIEEGCIQSQFAALLPFSAVTYPLGVATVTPVQTGDPVTVSALAGNGGFVTTSTAVQALYSAITITDEPPFTAMARMGLKMIQGTP